MEGNSDIGPQVCSPEAIGKPVLSYLWCMGFLCRGCKERVVEEGRFSVRISDDWCEKPIVTRQTNWDAHFRFMNEKNNKQWVSIEYMNPPAGMSAEGNLAAWVDFPMMITGSPMLDVPDDQKVTVLKMTKVEQLDKTFMEKHGLDQMLSYLGTVRIGDMVCCVYLVLMKKGRESWKMEVVFPAVYTKVAPGEEKNGSYPIVHNDEELANVVFNRAHFNIAGVWIGHFRILSN